MSCPMTRLAGSAAFLCALLSLAAANPAHSRTPPRMAGPPLPELLTSAAVDTVDLYGGPGTLEGKFETAEGLPDEQGWVTSDGTWEPADHWNISTYNAANLDTLVAENHAWWCGDDLAPCWAEDPAEGYGNDWDQSLSWQGAALDPALPAQVRVTGMLNCDTEPGYDQVRVVFDITGNLSGMWGVVLDGQLEDHVLDVAYTYDPDEYLGDRGGIRVRVQFLSDEAWSDEDCLWPTGGAVQVDNLQVTISQDGQPDQVSPVETCEPGDPVSWQPTPAPGYGDFAQLWTGLQDEDPQRDNVTPQWAFIDDGIVQPGTGPTHCNQGVGCYGPDSCVVDIYGGLCGSINEGLRNHVTSPPVALTAAGEMDLAGLVLSADAYFHSDLTCGILMALKVDMLSTADPAGLEGWTSGTEPVWFYGGDPEYRRIVRTFTADQFVADARFVKIRITADDARFVWCWTWLWSTPAPYFDNVRLQAVPIDPLVPVPDLADSRPVSVHPNPFNPRTSLTLFNPRDQRVRAAVYDLRGRLVSELVDAILPGGTHVFDWQGRDRDGRSQPSGTYFFKIRLGDEVHTRKAVLLR